jgi:hypothetical protein
LLRMFMARHVGIDRSASRSGTRLAERLQSDESRQDIRRSRQPSAAASKRSGRIITIDLLEMA